MLILRGVMSDHPGAAVNSALVLLHANVTRDTVDGLRPSSQIWTDIIAFPGRNNHLQSKAALTVELMITLFIINRPYRISTPHKAISKGN